MCNEKSTAAVNASTTENVFKRNGQPNGMANQLALEKAADNVDMVDSGPAIPQNVSGVTTTIPVNGGNLNKFSDSLPNHLDFDDICNVKGMYVCCDKNKHLRSIKVVTNAGFHHCVRFGYYGFVCLI